MGNLDKITIRVETLKSKLISTGKFYVDLNKFIDFEEILYQEVMDKVVIKNTKWYPKIGLLISKINIKGIKDFEITFTSKPLLDWEFDSKTNVDEFTTQDWKELVESILDECKITISYNKTISITIETPKSNLIATGEFNVDLTKFISEFGSIIHDEIVDRIIFINPKWNSETDLLTIRIGFNRLPEAGFTFSSIPYKDIGYEHGEDPNKFSIRDWIDIGEAIYYESDVQIMFNDKRLYT